jgi:hypothetical protein
MSNQELDRLIDGVLPGYLAEPPTGIEQRILARVRRPRVWPWAAGLAVAAAIAVAIVVPRPAAVDAPPLVAVHASKAPAVQVTPVRVSGKRPVRPIPLSRRERTLIEFAKANPELARQVLVDAPERMAGPLEMQPIAIELITIEPLDSASGGE